MVLQWEDDLGAKHKFYVPGSYLIPKLNQRLLSPQHWAKAQKDPIKDGTGSETLPNKTILFWNGKRNKLTIPHSKSDNCATFRLGSGYKPFHAFCTTYSDSFAKEDDNPLRCESILMPDGRYRINRFRSAAGSVQCGGALSNSRTETPTPRKEA